MVIGKTLSFCSLLLIIIVELSLIETRFVNFKHAFFKLNSNERNLHENISTIVKLFEDKLDQNQLYDDDILSVALLTYIIVLKRKQSVGPDVYWYSRKG